jgi:hypothetical protein
MLYFWLFEFFFNVFVLFLLMFIGDEFVMVEIFEVHSGGHGVKKQMQS